MVTVPAGDAESRWAAAYFQGIGQVKVKAHREVVRPGEDPAV